MSNEIPTAEEFLQNHHQISHFYNDETDKMCCFSDDVHKAMIEFAKLHVKAALEKAAENATVTPIDHEEISEGSFRPIWGVDENSILEAYPEDLIK